MPRVFLISLDGGDNIRIGIASARLSAKMWKNQKLTKQITNTRTFELVVHLLFIIPNDGSEHLHQHPLLDDADGLGGEHVGARARHRHQRVVQPGQHPGHAAELRVASDVRRNEEFHQGPAGEQHL